MEIRTSPTQQKLDVYTNPQTTARLNLQQHWNIHCAELILNTTLL